MFNEKSKTQTSHNGPFDDDPVSRLLSDLKRVDAPGDFEFRVRAGIAERRESSVGRSWLPGGLKVAVPTALLLMVGGYVGIGSLYSPASDQAAVAPPHTVEAAPPAETRAVVQEPIEAAPAVNTERFVALNATPRPIEAVNRLVAAVPEKSGPERPPANRGGSYDEAIREGQSISLFNADPNAGPNPGKLSVKSVLGNMGISASLGAAGWVVISASGAALRSGVKAGDVIEAVNGQPVGRGTSFNSSFNGSSLRVRRDGKSVQISLR